MYLCNNFDLLYDAISNSRNELNIMMTDKEKSEQLTHWKTGVAKSPYLGSWDLPGNFENVQLTIKEVRKEVTKGLKENDLHNIIFWQENAKPMILNATNAKMLRAITGSPHIEKWANHKIELRVEKNVKAFGAVHDTLRIVNKKIAIKKPVLDSKHAKYEEVKGRLIDGSANFDVVSKFYEISDELKKAVEDGKANRPADKK